jgi:hypothetical protein
VRNARKFGWAFALVLAAIAGPAMNWSQWTGAAGPEPGDLYSIGSQGGNGFKVVKVLARDPGLVHVRVYGNQFPERPKSLRLEELKAGTGDSAESFGMAHLPVGEAIFASWKPQLITKVGVAEDELAAYRAWKLGGAPAPPTK